MISGGTVAVVDERQLPKWHVIGFQVVETGTTIEAIRRLRDGLAIDAAFRDVVIPGDQPDFDLARWIAGNRSGLSMFQIKTGQTLVSRFGSSQEFAAGTLRTSESIGDRRRVPSVRRNLETLRNPVRIRTLTPVNDALRQTSQTTFQLP